jgi:hypothetical protein
MRRLLLLSCLLSAATGALAQQPDPVAPAPAPQAQPPQAPQVRGTIEREVKAQPGGQPVRIGVYTNIQPDCTSGELPAVKLGQEPKHGAVVVRQGRIRLTNHKQCLALEVPAFIAFYRPKSDFPGKDVLTLEVRNKEGKLQVQRITIVTGKPAGDSI